jgi:hypothetical protein
LVMIMLDLALILDEDVVALHAVENRSEIVEI